MKETTENYVISIMSRDRVGIVYEISKAISDLEGNIADIRQSVLCGYFTMILLVSFPKKVDQRSIERKLAEVDAHSETQIDTVVKKTDGLQPNPPVKTQENTYVLTATGTDKIGFVANVSSFCVSHKINILDLSTTEANGEYVMILILDVTQCGSIDQVRKDLQQFSNENSIKVVMQHNDIFRALNEIKLPIR